MILWWIASVADAAEPVIAAVDLAAAYADVAQVAAAPKLAVGSVVAGLTGRELGYDAKLALACAATHGRSGSAEAFARAVAAAAGLPVGGLPPERVTAPDRALLAYLTVREDPDDLAPVVPDGTGVASGDPIALAAGASRDRPDDFALATTAFLVSTADRTRTDACAAGAAWDALLAKVPAGSRNLRPAAVDAITAAVRAGCPAASPSPHPPP